MSDKWRIPESDRVKGWGSWQKYVDAQKEEERMKNNLGYTPEQREKRKQFYADKYEVDTYRKKKEIDAEYAQKRLDVEKELLEVQRRMMKETRRENWILLKEQAEYLEAMLTRMTASLD